VSVRDLGTLTASSGPPADEPALDRSHRFLATLGVMVLLALAGVVAPVLIAAHYRALGIPRSDDWSYLLTLFRWVGDGRLGFNHWAAPPLIGQLVVAAPVAAIFDHSIAAVHLTSAFVGWIGLLAVVAMGRRLVSTSAAVVVALTIAIGPLVLPMAATFMTDHWAFAMQTLSLALAFEAFRRAPFSIRWWTASVAVAFFAVCIRQYALVPAFAVIGAGYVEARRAADPKRLRTVYLVIGAFVVATLVLGAWWVARPGISDLTPRGPSVSAVSDMIRGDLGYLRLVGLLLFPVAFVARPVRVVRRAWVASQPLTFAIVLGAGGVLLLQFSEPAGSPFVGNYVDRVGVLAQDVLTGTRPPVFTPWMFGALAWISTFGALVLLLAAVPMLGRVPERWKARTWWPDSPITAILAVNVIAFVLFVNAEAAVGLPLFDRYALPVLPVIAFAALRAARERVDAPVRLGPTAWTATVAALVVIGAVGFAFAAESASYDGSRWRVAEMATHAGFTPLQVDGGFEWDAWHSGVGPPYWPLVAAPQKKTLRRAFDAPFCVRVSIGDSSSPTRIVARVTSGAPTRRPAEIVAARIAGRCAS
jgi:hypothetical protein